MPRFNASAAPHVFGQRVNIAKRKFRFATWNVRTLKQIGKAELCAKALDIYNIDVACLQETRLPEEKHFTVAAPDSEQSYRVFCSPATPAGHGGVSIAIRSEWCNSVSRWRAVNDRLLLLTIDTSPIQLTVICACAPTNACSDATRREFYSQLDRLLDSVSRTQEPLRGHRGRYECKMRST